MKKGPFLSMALILTMFLTLILFPGNKVEAYYGGFGAYGGLYGVFGIYGGLYGAYGGFGFGPVSTPEGYIYTPSRVSSEFGYYESAPSPPIQYHLESEILPPESSFAQNTQWPGPLNNFPSFMPSFGTVPFTFGTVPVTYSVYPIAPEWPWSDFPAIYSSTLIYPWTPHFLSNPYRPYVYPTVSPIPIPLAASR